MTVCPAPAPGLIPGSPGYIISFIVSVVFPAYVVLGIALFLYYRKTSVYLRKRPVEFILITAAGCFGAWASTSLFDILRPAAYPCWLFGLVFYCSPAIVMTPLILKDARYLSDVAAIRMGRDMAASTRQISTRQSSASGWGDLDIQIVERDASLANFAAHLRTTTGVGRKEDDRLKNIKFTLSPAFVAFWGACVILPFFVAYIVRIAVDPAWNQGCYGCDINATDGIIMTTYFFVGTTTGVKMHINRRTSKDALFITRETQLCWFTGYFAGLGTALYLGDPGNYYAQGLFDWRLVCILCPWGVIHIQTVHQVWNARKLQQHLLMSDTINRTDRFVDVMSNKDLRTAFRNHMDAELSAEIYLFLEAVEAYRNGFDRHKDARFFRAQKIMDTFIDRSSKLEINLSSQVRERLMEEFGRWTDSEAVEVSLFDQAYDEIKSALLVDGFARFLTKQGSKLFMSKPKTPTNSERGLTPTSLSNRNTPTNHHNSSAPNTPSSVKRTPQHQMTVKFSFDDIDRDAKSTDSQILGAAKPASEV